MVNAGNKLINASFFTNSTLGHLFTHFTQLIPPPCVAKLFFLKKGER